MRKAPSILILFVACAILWPGIEARPKKENLPRMPGAALLVGYPPGSLAVTTPGKTSTLAEGDAFYLRIYPTLSRDGLTVAATLVRSDGVPRHLPLMSIATYSVSQGKWREYESDYKDVQNFQGGIAIAPDQSKLAFAVAVNGNDPPVQVHVIDLKTGAEKIYSARGYDRGVRLSWSPDGRKIVYDTVPMGYSLGVTEYAPEVWVLDLDSRKNTNC